MWTDEQLSYRMKRGGISLTRYTASNLRETVCTNCHQARADSQLTASGNDFNGSGTMPDDSGWIKLHRALLDGPIIQHAGMLQVWIYCLLRANWEPRKVVFPGCLSPIQLDRGEFVTGRNSLHAALYPDSNKDNPVSRTVWRWLESLEAMECVTLKTVSNRCTVVTVCKYKTYQAEANGQCPANVPPVSNPCPAGVPPVSTNKNNTSLEVLKNQRNEDSCSEPAKQASKPTADKIRPELPVGTVMTFECVGQTTCWHLTQPQIDAWQELFPAVDVAQQCRSAKAWCDANKSKRKTAGGMSAFLVKWLTKEQNAGTRGPGQATTQKRVVPSIPSYEEIVRRGYNPVTGLGPE